jgi:hypothetical protein
MRTIVAENKHRSKEITLKGSIALLLCFLIGVAAIVLLLYTLF